MTEDDDGDRSGKSGDIARRMVTGFVMTGAGWRLGHGMEAVTAGFSPLVEIGLGKAMAEWTRAGVFTNSLQDKLRRAESMAEAAAEAAGMSQEEFADLAGETEENRQMAEDALNAATSTVWPPKVRALGRLLAAGLLAGDGDRILFQDHALPAMAEMERLHVSLLELLVNYGPPTRVDQTEPVPYEPASSPEGSFNVGNRIWTANQVIAARPELSPIFLALTGTLIRHGLIFQRDKTREALAQLARLTENRAAQRQAVAQGKQQATVVGPPSAPTVERVLTTNTLGERVIGFYREAAEEPDSITAAGQDGEAPDGTSGPGGSAG